MKRTPLKAKQGFKRKTLEEVRAKQAQKRSNIDSKPRKTVKPTKTARSKKKKTYRQKLEEKIWEECKRIIRARYGDKCYTCPAVGLEGVNQQTGHGKPKGALPLQFKYDLRNLRVQCLRDNIHLGGLSDLFIAKLEKEKEGLAFLEESCRKTEEGWIIRKETNLVGKEATIFLENLLEEYKKL